MKASYACIWLLWIGNSLSVESTPPIASRVTLLD